MKLSNMEVTYLGGFGDDSTVVNAARVSFNKEVELPIGEGDAKLIRYLAVHKHHSPFNHAFLSFRIKAPIFVARQLVKHKFMPWNEVSRRYVDDEPEFFFPDGFREKAENVKQGSKEKTSIDPFRVMVDDGEGGAFTIYGVTDLCLELYKSALESGICAEQSRMFLPLNTMTEWIWSGTLGAFLDMLKLRLDPHTQKETRDVAEAIAKEVDKHFPISFQEYLNA